LIKRKRRVVMKKHVVLLVSLAMVAVSGCAKKVDLEAARAALRQADTDWAATLTAKDLEGFLGYFAPDAVVLAPHLPQMNGSGAIREWATTSFNFPGFAVTWSVTSAEVAEAGDIGYTLGNFTFEVDFGGSPLKDSGKYATIWKKQPDGSWKVAVDAFNSELPMTPLGSATPEDTTAVQGQ
jgi:ketosteroid isomerase-like protein